MSDLSESAYVFTVHEGAHDSKTMVLWRIS